MTIWKNRMLTYPRLPVVLLLETICAVILAACQTYAPVPLAATAPVAISVDQLPAEFHQGPRASQRLEFLRDSLIRADEERRVANNEATTRHFYEIIEAGGFSASLQRASAQMQRDVEVAGAGLMREVEPRAGKLKGQIEQLKRCETPKIIDFPERVKYQAHFILFGCSFGATPGEVRLIISPGGGYLTLSVAAFNWHPDSLLVEVPALHAVPDLPAKLVVVRADGVQSQVVDVEYVSERGYDILDVRTHPTALHALCAPITQDDECYATYKDAELTVIENSYGGFHAIGTFIINTSSTPGHDWWFINLQNGWTAISVEIYGQGHWNCGEDVREWYKVGRVSVPSISVPTISFPSFSEHQPGPLFEYISDFYSQLVGRFEFVDPPSSFNIFVPWWVDYACSSVHYEGRILLFGPVFYDY